jgi:hypothetical protein
MKTMWRALKPHGKAYIVSQGLKLMKRTLEYPWCVKMWSVETKSIGIGGYEVYVYILTRLDQ